jgi:hypothetical protein
MSEETTLVRIEIDVIQAVQKDASSAAHQNMPYGRAIAFIHGEYRRLKKLEKTLAPDITTVSLTPKGKSADCG